MQVKQYFNFTICPLIITSRVRGGGRYVELPVLSKGGRKGRWEMSKPRARNPNRGGEAIAAWLEQERSQGNFLENKHWAKTLASGGDKY